MDANLAAEPPDHFSRDRQSEPRSQDPRASLASEARIRLKHALELVRRDTWPIIRHGDEPSIPFDASDHPHPAAGGRVCEGIAKYVGEDLLTERSVGRDARVIPIEHTLPCDLA